MSRGFSLSDEEEENVDMMVDYWLVALFGRVWLRLRPASRSALSRRTLILVACGLAALSLTGCLVVYGAAQPAVNLDKVAGTWVSGDGASITFTSRGTVTVTNYHDPNGMPPACWAGSGSGTWQLHLNSEDYPEPPIGTPENLLDLLVTSGAPGGNCAISMEMTTWDTGNTQGLCVQLDPDNSCDGYIFTKR